MNFYDCKITRITDGGSERGERPVGGGRWVVRGGGGRWAASVLSAHPTPRWGPSCPRSTMGPASSREEPEDEEDADSDSDAVPNMLVVSRMVSPTCTSGCRTVRARRQRFLSSRRHLAHH